MIRLVVLAAFFCSGLTSLVLETLWVRSLTLVFGGTTFAIVSVLTAFMTGIALGSFLAGRFSSRIRRPLLAYGILEAGVALYALASLPLIAKLPTLALWTPAQWSPLAIAFVRFLLCLGVLLLPTVLMGATLPVLSLALVHDTEEIGTEVGTLYSINTFGAVLGALCGGFVFLPLWGHTHTLIGISTLLLALAAVMAILGQANSGLPGREPSEHLSESNVDKGPPNAAQVAKPSESEQLPDDFSSQHAKDSPQPITARATETSESRLHSERLSHTQSDRPPTRVREAQSSQMGDLGVTRPQPPEANVPRAKERRLVRGGVLVCLGLTGALAMVCQVVWSRALAMVIGSSTYAFALILGLFLAGLALGASYAAWRLKRLMALHASPLAAIHRSWVRMLLATGVSVGLGTILLDRLPLLFVALVYHSLKDLGPIGLFVVKALIASLPIVLPTFLMGTFFPLALRVYTRVDDGIGQNVGRLYAANTLGAILGSAAAGFMLIPLFGLQKSLILCASLYLFTAWGLCVIEEEKLKPRPRLASFVFIACFALWLAPGWHPGRMSLGMFRLSLMESTTYKAAMTPSPILFYKEGLSATVAVEGDARDRALKVNGKADASSLSDRPTQLASAAIPLLLHGRAKDVNIIGWGSGMTAGAALHFPLKRLVAIELEPQVIAGSRYFDAWNYRPLQDPRLQLRINDGRNVLLFSPHTYDVLSSEPSNPWMAGVANLFTVEFFRIAQRRLKPGGLYCQFVPLYELSYKNILTLLRSVRTVFPYIGLFEVEPSGYDTLLVASNTPMQFDLARIQRDMRAPRLARLWKHMNIHDAFDWLPRLRLTERGIDKLLQETPVPTNTDNHNVIEFTAPIDLLRQSTSSAGARFRRKAKAIALPFSHTFRWGKHKRLPAALWAKTALAYLRYADPKGALQAIFNARKAGLSDTKTRFLLRLLRMLVTKQTPSLSLKQHTTLPPNAQQLLHKALQRQKNRQHKACYNLLSPYTATTPKTKHLARELQKTPAFWLLLGMCARGTQRYPQTIHALSRYLRRTKLPPTTKPATKPTSQTTRAPLPRPSTPTQPTTRPVP